MAVVPLEDILDPPVMRPAIVRTARHACRRPVAWASVIEMPVEDFVRPYEFVLTTGIGCGAGGERFNEFVSQVTACDAAAVGVSSGYSNQEVPQETIEMAEEASFPIIELPCEVSFADITRAVSEAPAAEEHQALVRSETLQATMLEHAPTACTLWLLHQKPVQEAQTAARTTSSGAWPKGRSPRRTRPRTVSVLGYRLGRTRVCVLGRPESVAEQDRRGSGTVRAVRRPSRRRGRRGKGRR